MIIKRFVRYGEPFGFPVGKRGPEPLADAQPTLGRNFSCQSFPDSRPDCRWWDSSRALAVLTWINDCIAYDFNPALVKVSRAAARSAFPVRPAGSVSTKWNTSGVLNRSSRSFDQALRSSSLKSGFRATTMTCRLSPSLSSGIPNARTAVTLSCWAKRFSISRGRFCCRLARQRPSTAR
jgi:hypothetical protein